MIDYLLILPIKVEIGWKIFKLLVFLIYMIKFFHKQGGGDFQMIFLFAAIAMQQIRVKFKF